MSDQQLRELFAEGAWYHCIRHGELVSNGIYDLEPYLAHYHLRESYRGQTVLDVGCADGFFSLLLKARGAERVCAIDSNAYDGTVAIQPSAFNQESFGRKYAAFVADFNRFRAVYERYGLTTPNKLLLLARLKSLDIEYHTGTIYDLAAYGTFDLVLCNDLLEHLRDPITAIEQVYMATRREAIFSVSSALQRRWFGRRRPVLEYKGHQTGGSFYSLSEAAVAAMCRAAGFRDTRVVSRFWMATRRMRRASYHCVVHAYR